MNELDESIWAELRLIERAAEGGPIVLAGLAMLVISAVLLLTWFFLIFRRGRLFPLFGGVAICLAIFGYISYDWWHIWLNLSMRDAQAVRQDCVRLLQLQRETVKDDFTDLYLHDSELPASFTRLGARFVQVSRENVQISLIPSGIFGGAWGILYDPQRSYPTEDRPNAVRPTWYRDFYEFRELGE